MFSISHWKRMLQPVHLPAHTHTCTKDFPHTQDLWAVCQSPSWLHPPPSCRQGWKAHFCPSLQQPIYCLCINPEPSTVQRTGAEGQARALLMALLPTWTPATSPTLTHTCQSKFQINYQHILSIILSVPHPDDSRFPHRKRRTSELAGCYSGLIHRLSTKYSQGSHQEARICFGWPRHLGRILLSLIRLLNNPVVKSNLLVAMSIKMPYKLKQPQHWPTWMRHQGTVTASTEK